MGLIVEEEPSYVRIVFNERNKNNQVKVFLQEAVDSKKPITVSTSDRQLSTVLKARKKPYIVMLVYQHLEEHD